MNVLDLLFSPKGTIKPQPFAIVLIVTGVRASVTPEVPAPASSPPPLPQQPRSPFA